MSGEEVRKPEWLVEGYPPLGIDLVGQAAVEGQTVEYPQIVRTTTDPPIYGQKLGLLSFMLFKEPRTLSSGKPVYGYVNLRGNWPDASQARSQAAKIIREVDSKHMIRIAPVGGWVPITEEDAFVREKYDVKTRDDEMALRDEAAKEKEAEQRRMQREIREREEEAKNSDIYDDPESLKFYSMRRVTELRLIEARENQLRQIETINENLRKVQKETKKLEKIHPEYLDEWIDCYNEERRKAGVPDYVPSEEQELEHQNAVFTDSEEECEDCEVTIDEDDLDEGE